MLPFVTSEGTVAESLTELNRRLVPELGRGEFVALTLVRYRPADRSVELANAGAPDPYLVRADRAPQPLSAPGPRLPLGIRSEVTYSSRRIEIGDDDRLLLITDGLPEARDSEGEPLGYQALESMLSDEPLTGTPSSWLTGLFERVQLRTGRLPEDDWTAAMLVPNRTEDAP